MAAREQVELPPIERLYALLSRLADERQPCPNGLSLAAEINVAEGAVPGLLQKLSRTGRITVTTKHRAAGHGKVQTYRLVEIVATRRVTAHPPRPSGEPATIRSAAQLEIEAATLAIRQSGRVMFDVSVEAAGWKPGQAWRVDGKLLDREEVLALADRLRRSRSVQA